MGEDPAHDEPLALPSRGPEQARSCFERALARGESPEALEGLSWAAWWLDDAGAVFGARERAYRLYMTAAETTLAPRAWPPGSRSTSSTSTAPSAVAARLARGGRDRLLEPLEPGPDHGWLAFQEGFVAHAGRRSGDRP